MWNSGFKLGLGDTIPSRVLSAVLEFTCPMQILVYDSRLSVWNTWSEILIFLLTQMESTHSQCLC